MAYSSLTLEKFFTYFLVYQGVLWTMPHRNQGLAHFDDEDYISGKGTIYRSTRGSCPDGWEMFGGKCYIFWGTNRSHKKTWSKAEEHCERLHSTLVSIHSTEEQNYLNNVIPPGSADVWIGLERLDKRDNFTWVDGSPQDFNNWSPGEPSEIGLKRTCAQMSFSGKETGTWKDVHCRVRRPYICQSFKGPNVRFLDFSSGDGEELCTDGICQNGGSCVDNIGIRNFQCICDHGYRGDRCEERSLCAFDVCGIGGTCVEDVEVGDFQCVCVDGYHGERCEEKESVPETNISDYIYIIGAVVAVVSLIIIVVIVVLIKRSRKRREDAGGSVAKPDENLSVSMSACKRTNSEED